jgi:mannosyltransferase OCH1-like enzyme
MNNIHQIYISDSKKQPSTFVSEKLEKVKNLYHDCNYTLYDADMCHEEVKSVVGGKLANLYDTITAYSFKADVARYCILYKYAGYYFDATICPEFRLKFENHPILYKAPENAIQNNLNAIDNGVMYFNDIKHEFLSNAIELSFKNIRSKNYGVHSLDITGPVMLGRLKEYNIQFGRSRWISELQKGAFLNDELHWLYKPSNTTFASFEGAGTNSYEKIWLDRKVFVD